ncbi:MAG: Hsp20/alpha crystallin family protein [Chloroflexi bacterium]|nr:Hsp20/alpha crystallin family protein [Chloroflexota bacterium]MCI0577612.1 Hsp20/alpha crystallin family protein [Chloroflexota bacterium]MCI0644168.1 Hsp20/alpha crystallin family protein [Chloroflexota bacterium]MCI0725249.1 Hsp20/alpha crystallin family protein [Chloroflexota bacterium]
MNINDLVPWRGNRGSNLAVRQEEDYPYSLQREVNRLFDDFFSGFDLAPSPWWGERTTFLPRVNVTEREKEIEVTAELPGLSQEDVDISLARDTLTIKGEKKQEEEHKGENYYRMERSYGQFSRTIPLPEGVVDPNKVEAMFKNGVLTITLPKRKEAQQVSKRITVKAG